MTLKGKRILVTGAGGFIGSHLTERLSNMGCHVVALLHYDCRRDKGNLEYLPSSMLENIDIRTGDICDPFFMMDVIRGCRVVFHLAALIGIPYSYLASASYVETNIMGTLNILHACLAQDVERIVHTSTSECYGTAQYIPIDEDHPLCAQSPYAATKIGADKLAESFHRAFTLPVSIIRPFNTFGPRQSDRAIIPTILGQLISGNPTLRLGSVKPVRDINYVDNIVDGFIAVASSEKTDGEVINIGSGIGLTIRQIAEMAMKVVGREIEIEQSEERMRPESSEVDRLICNNAKAQQIAGWSPSIDLMTGISRTAEFIRQHPRLYLPREYSI
jgi:NAD dependent epimerase/dehydratase